MGPPAAFSLRTDPLSLVWALVPFRAPNALGSELKLKEAPVYALSDRLVAVKAAVAAGGVVADQVNVMPGVSLPTGGVR